MYINDIHILYYVLFAVIGGFIGQFVDYCNKAFLMKERYYLKKILRNIIEFYYQIMF